MCCGKQRQKPQGGPRPVLPLASPHQSLRESSIRFEYFGRTGLTVKGPASGRTYRFERSGFQIEVDARDAASMSAIPNLTQVNGKSR